MRQIDKFLLGLGSILFIYSTASAGKTNNSTTFLGPTVRLGFASPINDWTAYNLAGEAGIQNYRIDGTLGLKLRDNQRLKVSVEYLWQDIRYGFPTDTSKQWVNQGAAGAVYEYEFCQAAYNPVASVNAYLSHAPTQKLSNRDFIFTTPFGFNIPVEEHRRIEGSNAGGVAPGVTIHPWLGGQVGLDVNYDHVSYDGNGHNSKNTSGYGGTVRVKQTVMNNVDVAVAAGVRQPFNNYAANIDWTNIPYYGRWTFGLTGEYTNGKQHLPSTYNIGLRANFFFDDDCETVSARREEAIRFMNYKDEIRDEMPVTIKVADRFLDWTAEPAGHMPEVLAISQSTVSSE